MFDMPRVARHRAEPPVARDPAPAAAPRVMAYGETDQFADLRDPRLALFLRCGMETESGIPVSVRAALRNTTVMRCVSLISFSIGMIPLHLRNRDTKEKASDHPLFRVLHRKPNAWQTSFEFRSFMQQQALTDGDAFARILRSRGQVTGLVPLPCASVVPRQRSDWRLEYEYQRPDGGRITLAPEDVFHLRYGISEDGIRGVALVKLAAEAIGLAGVYIPCKYGADVA